MTDPARQRRTDKGNPDVCTVFDYHKVFTGAQETAEIDVACRNAAIGCVECKNILANHLTARLAPIYSRRKELERNRKRIRDILLEGSVQARRIAAATMDEARDAMNVRYDSSVLKSQEGD